ncbi:hypothetical protein [Ligilactobacillus animalis]|jgi:hypothetical protein|nr:hypothetical protein [Ligilactobacillus animalis]
MRDKTLLERLRDSVALTLLELLQVVRITLYIGVVYGLAKVLGIM